MRIHPKAGLLIAITLLTLIVTFLLHPVAQSLTFHHFADTRSLWGIQNFGNVVSNLPFLVIGAYGILVVSRATAPMAIRYNYLFLFLGVLTTGLGSAYYHWHPDNDTLVWDRIPMTIVFMSFLAALLTELVSRKLGVWLLLPLVAVGVGSVIYWHHTETLGRGDLRLYGWVQYYPMLATLMLLGLYYKPAVKAILPSLIWIVVWYVIAKVFEQLDFQIYQAIGVSGHSLKHLAAAVSTWYFVVLFRKLYVQGTKSH